jgi:hypothetical protein
MILERERGGWGQGEQASRVDFFLRLEMYMDGKMVFSWKSIDLVNRAERGPGVWGCGPH